MNAYEIADGLSKSYIENDNHGLFNKRIQVMLRQQADRIAELEVDVKKKITMIKMWEATANKTHTVKQLSDEEIEQIAVRYYVGSRILPIQFARAIIKEITK